MKEEVKMIKDLTSLSWSMGIDSILPKDYIEKIQQMITMRLSYLKEVGLIEEKRI